MCYHSNAKYNHIGSDPSPLFYADSPVALSRDECFHGTRLNDRESFPLFSTPTRYSRENIERDQGQNPLQKFKLG